MSKPNSTSVDLTFTNPGDAQNFYFDAPGEGVCTGHKCYKVVEGNVKQAVRLERMARRARGVTTINCHTYNVDI